MAIVSSRLYLTTQENKYKQERFQILCISFDQIIRTLLKIRRILYTREQH